MAAARGTSLFPPDPRYIPGYEGFVPQFSYQFGETFGKTTFRLLTDPGVRKSPHSLLAPLPKLKFIEDFTGTRHEVPDYIPVHPGDLSPRDGAAGAGAPGTALEPSTPAPRQGPVGERGAWGHTGPMEPARPHTSPAEPARPRTRPPGHPGLRLAYEYEQEIPPRRSALPHDREGRLPAIAVAGAPRGAQAPCPPPHACAHGGSLPRIPETEQPVKIESATVPAVAEWADAESCEHFPRLPVPHAIRQKATSGYTGYIPRYAWITGVNYIQGVKDAMNEFDRNQFLLQNPVSEFGKRLPQSYWPNNRIYTSAGLIPFYTGFVPTLRHSYALTFGNSTRKAFQKEQRRRACALRKKNFNDACTAFEVTLEQEEEHNTDRRSFE
ncbi:protein FAM166A [Nothoprocta perdicaria]|uniref:protein FAM166A n=1 Tax=Nothoprocta perdicaria TaxID=30464 RepID=UPI000E1C0504|nr:protein FAM166A [Nothoprocta perdicaria]